MEVRDAVAALAVEGGQRIGDRVARKRENALIDDDDRDLGIGDRLAAEIGHGDVHFRLAARLDRRRFRLGRDVEFPRFGRDLQIDLSARESRPLGELFIDLALVVRPRRGSDQVDLRDYVRQILFFERDAERDRRILDGEPFGLHQTSAAQRQNALGLGERRYYEQFGSFAGLVILLVRDQLRHFLFDSALRRGLAARNPNRELALVPAFFVVHHAGRDLVLTAGLGDEFTGLALVCKRFGRAGLLVDHLFDPTSLLESPILEHGLELDVAVRDEVAVKIGNDRLDRHLLALLDERSGRLDADV